MDSSSDTQPFAPLKSSHTAGKSSNSDKQTGYYLPSLFTETSESLMQASGGERLTQFAEDFHAPTSALPEKEPVLKAKQAVFGKKWRGSFCKWDQKSYSWKTHQCSLHGGLESFSEIWPQWGMMQDGECWEATTSMLPMLESAFGSWLNIAGGGQSGPHQRVA